MSTNNMHPTDRVRKAIAHADIIPEGALASYFTKCLMQRAARGFGQAMGSTYPLTVDALRLGILSLEWEPYKHAAILFPAVGFSARGFGGHIGVVRTADLNGSDEITLLDPKGTGFVEGVCRTWKGEKPRVDFTVALLGPAPDGTETLWTFHPGEPIAPSRITTLDRNELVVTKARAIELGLEWVKL